MRTEAPKVPTHRSWHLGNRPPVPQYHQVPRKCTGCRLPGVQSSLTSQTSGGDKYPHHSQLCSPADQALETVCTPSWGSIPRVAPHPQRACLVIRNLAAELSSNTKSPVSPGSSGCSPTTQRKKLRPRKVRALAWHQAESQVSRLPAPICFSSQQ